MRRSHDKKHHDSALKVFPGSHSDTVPPDSIPNSEVKRISADGSVGFPHVRVGHCQVPLKETRLTAGFLRLAETKNGVRVLYLSRSERGYTLIPRAEIQRNIRSLFFKRKNVL